MTDNLSSADRLKTMRAVKSKATGPERVLFAMLAGMHIKGWRKNFAQLPGKPDVVFPEQRLVIFVDGCFWHKCPVCNKKLPTSNREYWERKIERNADRAHSIGVRLGDEGWQVLRIWEHELASREGKAAVHAKIRDAIHSKGVYAEQ